jgi:hypothetical protein
VQAPEHLASVEALVLHLAHQQLDHQEVLHLKVVLRLMEVVAQ